MMHHIKRLAWALAVCGVALSFPLAAADGDARKVAAERQDVTQAQKKARQTSAAADQAAQALRRAETAHAKGEDQLRQALAAATKTQSEHLGLPGLYTERNRLRAQIEKRQDAIVQELKAQPDYQAKVTAAEAANKKLGEIAGDTTLSDDQRRRLVSEVTPVTRQPMEARNHEFEADAKLKELNQQFRVADLKAAQLQKELAKAIEADGSVVKARTELKQSASALNKAKKDLAEAEKENRIAQSGLQQENRQLDQAKAKQAADNRRRNQRW